MQSIRPRQTPGLYFAGYDPETERGALDRLATSICITLALRLLRWPCRRRRRRRRRHR